MPANDALAAFVEELAARLDRPPEAIADALAHLKDVASDWSTDPNIVEASAAELRALAAELRAAQAYDR